MKARAYSAEGKARRSRVELPASVFDGRVSEAALHQAVTAHLANRRQGTASTRTRSTIRGGGRKPWRQKGTGRARHGSIRSPIWTGGAVTFGPQPRDHRTRLPRNVRRLAIQSALNARALEDALLVVDALELEAPRTRTIADLLAALELDGAKVLILTDGTKRDVYLSARNIPDVEVRPWGEASAYDVLWADAVVVEATALSGAEGPGAEEEGTEEAADEAAEEDA